uniref:ATP synthase F0 subunit 8 n=1 Tax=Psacasta exanthematica TaxID=2080400 RepID=A0A2P1CLU2_9HEMI|nr:ATP synthase F0 subunit 8 [Psacasta exanthematica]
MPQMAPLYWEVLFFTFMLSMLLTSIIMYHVPKIKETKSTMKQSINQINWKW